MNKDKQDTHTIGMTDMSKELRLCPLCGKDDIAIVDVTQYGSGAGITCNSCECSIWAVTVAEAIAKWNKRHGDWVSVKDGLPEDKGCIKILILDKGTVYTGYYSKNRGFEWWAGAHCNLDKPDSQKTITHYRLINPPEGA